MRVRYDPAVRVIDNAGASRLEAGLLAGWGRRYRTAASTTVRSLSWSLRARPTGDFDLDDSWADALGSTGDGLRVSVHQVVLNAIGCHSPAAFSCSNSSRSLSSMRSGRRTFTFAKRSPR